MIREAVYYFEQGFIKIEPEGGGGHPRREFSPGPFDISTIS
jgi:hypothetical protein